MKILFATLALVALSAAPIDLVPTAAADGCTPEIACEYCLVEAPKGTDCVVPNPCDPRLCYVWFFHLCDETNLCAIWP